MKRRIGYIIVFLLLIPLLLYVFGGGFGLKQPTIKLPKDLHFAHRGVTLNHPENTIEAIKAVASYGLNGIELDIRTTADDSLVIFHDADGNRMLNDSRVVKQINYSELTKLNIQGKDSIKYIVPTVRQAMSCISDSVYIYFDVKAADFRTIESLVNYLGQTTKMQTTILASSRMLPLAFAKRCNPKIVTALEGYGPGKEGVLKFIPKKWQPDFVAGFIQQANKKHIAKLKANNLLDRKIFYGFNSDNQGLIEKYKLNSTIIDIDTAYLRKD